MIPWAEIGAGVGALIAGILGTHYVKEWNTGKGEELNHGHQWVREEATEKVLAALTRIDTSIKEGNTQTARLIRDHSESSEASIRMFQTAIAAMKQDCAVSHAKLLMQAGFKPPGS